MQFAVFVSSQCKSILLYCCWLQTNRHTSEVELKRGANTFTVHSWLVKPNYLQKITFLPSTCRILIMLKNVYFHFSDPARYFAYQLASTSKYLFYTNCISCEANISTTIRCCSDVIVIVTVFFFCHICWDCAAIRYTSYEKWNVIYRLL